MNTRRHNTVTLAAATLLALLALVWLPTQAQAQFSFTLGSPTISAAPGDVTPFYLGTLSNTGGADISLDGAVFNLVSGPTGADLSSAVTFNDFAAPDPLASGQVYQGSIFSLFVDPNALLGTYTGNFLLTYGGQSVGQDIRINVANSGPGPAPVPEAGTLLTLSLTLTCFAAAYWRRQARRLA